MSIVNISAYKFVSLDELSTLRERMLERCTALALKGTILLAPEGINLNSPQCAIQKGFHG